MGFVERVGFRGALTSGFTVVFCDGAGAEGATTPADALSIALALEADEGAGAGLATSADVATSAAGGFVPSDAQGNCFWN